MRPCPKCGAKVSDIAERCPDCGQTLPLAMPWWGWLLGGFLVLLLFLAFSDFQTMFEVFGRVLASLRGE
jgi:hypothetical protein